MKNSSRCSVCPSSSYFPSKQATVTHLGEWNGQRHATQRTLVPYWATFNQIKELGGNLVNARGKGVPIIFYKSMPAKDGEEEGQKRFVIRNSHVFNLDLVSGIDADSVNVDPVGQASLDQDAQAVVTSYLEREELTVSHGSPAYVPAIDAVRMPSVDEVLTTDEYYSTYFHELAHRVCSGFHN